VRRIRGESALFVKDLESGAERPVFEGLDQDMQEVWAVHGTYPNMDWTPDSQSIVFWAGGSIKRVNVASGETLDIPFHVKDTRTVYDAPRPKIDVAPATFTTSMVRNAEVSPDGSKVVFESAGRLYIKSLPDGQPKALTRDAMDHFEYDPSWSRDGRYIAFVNWDDQELGHIHRVRAAGGRSERLTSIPRPALFAGWQRRRLPGDPRRLPDVVRVGDADWRVQCAGDWRGLGPAH
jgi:Tol biopolymer transport system component